MDDLKKLRQKVVEIEKLLNEKGSTLADFKKRQDEIVRQLAEKKFELEICEEEKVNLIKQVPTGEASEKAVFLKSGEIERLQREIKDLEGLLAGFPAAGDGLQREITALGKGLQGAVHDFWYQVCAIEKGKASANNSLLRAWAAFNLSGGGGSFGQFLSLHFNSYFTADLAKITNELRREYLEGR